MDFTVVHDPEANIIVATAQGDWESEKDDVLVRDIMKLVGATKTNRILLDIRSLKNIDLSTLRLYDRARSLQARRQKSEAFTARVAILHAARDKKSREKFVFFENTARNRGLPYRLFEDKEEAINWLTSA